MKKKREKIPFIMLTDRHSDLPLYQQVYHALRKAILNGEFAPNTRLPSSRKFAEMMGVSRITIVNAYDQLYAEGYLEGKIGAGTFVAKELPDSLTKVDRGKRQNPVTKTKAKFPVKQLSPIGRNLHFIASNVPDIKTRPKLQPFASGLAAIDKFPFDVWMKIAARFYRNPSSEIFSYSDAQGLQRLRQIVAERLKSMRGVNCEPEQIFITTGAQQALDLTLRIFLSEGDNVVIENPCYPNARGAFVAAGANLIPVPIDDNGLDVSQLPPKDKNVKLIYLTPSHQYPLGAVMSLARRLAIIEWAKKKEAFIIEDDYDSEFRYKGRPLASLQGLDSAGKVIYIGTFSKTIFPSLRIGYMVVPSALVKIFKIARIFNDMHSPVIEQAILADFIIEGHFDRHVRRMLMLYKERREYLLAACEKYLSGLLSVRDSNAGMNLIGYLPKGISDLTVSNNAKKKGLEVSPLSQHYINGARKNGLILGYTSFEERQLKNGVEKLKSILTASRRL